MVFNFVKSYFNNYMATLIPLYNQYLLYLCYAEINSYI